MDSVTASNTAAAPTTVPALQVQSLRFAYGKHAAPVLDIPAWEVAAGAQVFLRGPSGAGKSTLLNLLAGVLLPSSGIVRVLGQNLTALSSHKRDRFRAAHIGLVFQQFNLLPYLSVKDNIILAAHFNGRRGTEVETHLYKLLASLNLARDLAQQPAATLSVGQQQRVAIARALINDPQIIIVDEPTSSLDADARDAFLELLLGLTEPCGKTLVFVSHDQNLAHHFQQALDLSQINLAEKTGGAINAV